MIPKGYEAFIFILAALLTLEPFSVYGPGAISAADPGVLEAVADRRINAGWGLDSIDGYDLLIAPADCALLGRSGWLITNGNVYSSIVVDCQADVHAGIMESRGLLLDANRRELAHKQGWLVLK